MTVKYQVERIGRHSGYYINGTFYRNLTEVADAFSSSSAKLEYRMSKGFSLAEALDDEISDTRVRYPVYYKGVLYPSIENLSEYVPVSAVAIIRNIGDLEAIRNKPVDDIVERIIQTKEQSKVTVYGKEYPSIKDVAYAYRVDKASLYMLYGNMTLEESIEYLWSQESIEFNGKTYSRISHICREYKIDYSLFLSRIRKSGMAFQEALETPVGSSNNGKTTEFRGKIFDSIRHLFNYYQMSGSLGYNYAIRYGIKDNSPIILLQHLVNFMEEKNIEFPKDILLNSLPFVYYDGILFFKSKEWYDYIGIRPEKFTVARETKWASGLTYQEVLHRMKYMTVKKDGVEQKKYPTLNYDENKTLVFFVKEFREYVQQKEKG